MGLWAPKSKNSDLLLSPTLPIGGHWWICYLFDVNTTFGGVLGKFGKLMISGSFCADFPKLKTLWQPQSTLEKKSDFWYWVSLHIETARFKPLGHKIELFFLRNTLQKLELAFKQVLISSAKSFKQVLHWLWCSELRLGLVVCSALDLLWQASHVARSALDTSSWFLRPSHWQGV